MPKKLKIFLNVKRDVDVNSLRDATVLLIVVICKLVVIEEKDWRRRRNLLLRLEESS